MFKRDVQWSNSNVVRLGLMMVLVAMVSAVMVPRAAAQSNSWLANYWNSRDFSGAVVAQRFEAWPNYNWGAGSPIPGIVSTDEFSVQWTSSQNFEPGHYRFTVTADDGVRLWVNNFLVLDEWRETPAATYSVELNIPDGGQIPVQVDYFEARGDAQINVQWQKVSGPATTGPVLAQYWNNETLSGDPIVTRNELEVNYNWGNGSPVPGVIQTDHFSARWTRNMTLEAGEYEFTVTSDDGVRFFVDDQLLINAWHPASGVTYKATTKLDGGTHRFRVEYYENIGLAFVTVNGTRLDASGGGGVAPGEPFGVVNTSYLNVRSGPGVSFEVVEVVRGGTVVALTGFRDAAGVWVQIQLPDGTVGWVNRTYIDTSYPIDQLSPVVG